MNEIFSYLSLVVVFHACLIFSVESKRPGGEGGVSVMRWEGWEVLQAVGSISR